MSTNEYNSSVQKSFENQGQNANVNECFAPPSFHDSHETITIGEGSKSPVFIGQNQISMPLLLEDDDEQDLNMTQMVQSTQEEEEDYEMTENGNYDKCTEQSAPSPIAPMLSYCSPVKWGQSPSKHQ